jgi:hypothetical protein
MSIKIKAEALKALNLPLKPYITEKIITNKIHPKIIPIKKLRCS